MRTLAVLLLLGALAGAQEAGVTGATPPADSTRPYDRPPPEPPESEPRCGFCSTTGRTPFGADRRFDVEDDDGPGWRVLHCSAALESDNMALPWEVCRQCKTPSLKADAGKIWVDHQTAGKAWLAERRKVDGVAKVSKPLMHLETTHFVLAWNLPKIVTADKKIYDEHAAAHLYARRFEELYDRMRSTFGWSDTDNMRNKHYYYVFEKQAPMRICAPVYTGLQGETTTKRAGGALQESAVVCWWDKGAYPADADFWRHLTHTMVHQYTSVYYNPHWFNPGEFGLAPPWLNDKYGWIDEGLAHWYERQVQGRGTTSCFREQDNSGTWKGDDWKKNVWKGVMAGEIPAFSDVLTKPTQSLTAQEHQFSWSWIDYLMTKDPAAMGQAIKMCKQKAESRDLLQKCWGLTIIGLQSEWATWVKATYAPNAPKGK